MLGAVLSTLAIVSLHTLVLPHGSVATQVRVATNVFPHPRLVTVLNIVIVAVPHRLLTVGVSKLMAAPHSLVLFPAHTIVGTLVSMVAIVWLQILVLPQASVTTQVRVATNVFPHPR